MKDFNYEKGAELDHRLEKVMESHASETAKTSSETAPPASGMVSFLARPSIAQEIAELDVSKVAYVDLHEKIAGDEIDKLMESRADKLSAFHDMVKAAAAEATAVDPVKTAADLIRSGVEPQEAARRALG